MVLRLGGSLTPPDGVSLALALRMDARITALDLSSDDAASFIGPTGCAALAAALGELSALRSLDLRGNRGGDVGGRAFADALQTGAHALTSLDLRHNHISGATLSELFHAAMTPSSAAATAGDGGSDAPRRLTTLCGAAVGQAASAVGRGTTTRRRAGGGAAALPAKRLEQMLVARALPAYAREWQLAFRGVSEGGDMDWAPKGRFPPLHHHELSRCTVRTSLLRRAYDERTCENATSLHLIPPHPRGADCLGALRLASTGFARIHFALLQGGTPLGAHPGRCRVPERPRTPTVTVAELRKELEKRMADARGILDATLARLTQSAVPPPTATAAGPPPSFKPTETPTGTPPPAWAGR